MIVPALIVLQTVALLALIAKRDPIFRDALKWWSR